MGLKVDASGVSFEAAAVPATAQVGDPLTLAASGVLCHSSATLPPFVSVFEISSRYPDRRRAQQRRHLYESDPCVFFTATCARNGSVPML